MAEGIFSTQHCVLVWWSWKADVSWQEDFPQHGAYCTGEEDEDVKRLHADPAAVWCHRHTPTITENAAGISWAGRLWQGCNWRTDSSHGNNFTDIVGYCPLSYSNFQTIMVFVY